MVVEVIAQNLRVCRVCSIEKNLLENFRIYPGKKARTRICRACESQLAMAGHRKNPERTKQRKKESYYRIRNDPARYAELLEKKRASRRSWGERPENKEKILSYRKRNLEQRRAYEKKSQLKKKYGLTVEKFDEMLEAIDWKCPVCFRELTADPSKHGNNTANVDHCHTTGKVRGILCNPCNVGIGQLGDDLGRLERAVTYLRKHLDG